ncbi:selenocysteine lyase [Thermoplasmatales archaeon SW_10_69_26]|nr:MAG: selenocysteine lyase [Thermoplasmatales archaeon SW_10_69_26]
MSFDPHDVREDIPLLQDDEPPIYVDNACMTLKPDPVIEELNRYYEQTPVCAGRSTYRLAGEVDEAVQRSRATVASFLGADSADECVFTRNTTEAMNLAAKGLDLPTGSTVLTSDREHNSGLVPAQRLAEGGVHHEAVGSTEQGAFDLEAYKARMEEGDVSLVSLVHMSNLDGYITPMQAVAEIAHDHDALVLADGAQSAPHVPVDVAELGVDLFAFSVHKAMGPTGVGVLWGRAEILDEMDPLVAGGATIESTTLTDHELLDAPGRFEAGLQDFAGIQATHAALTYLEEMDRAAVSDHEEKLSRRLQEGIEALGCDVYGAPEAKGNGIVSFAMDGLDIHDLAVVLEDEADVCVRAGLHCLDSWFNARGLGGSCRASLYAYNTMHEVETILDTLAEIRTAVAG